MRPDNIHDFIPINVYAGGFSQKTRQVEEKVTDVLKGIPYREMLYTQSFQSRFSLPKQGIVSLDDGLLAIALEVTASQGSKLLLCGLHLYVDSEKVKLSLTNPGSGINPNSKALVNRFFAFRYPLNKSDVEFRMALKNEYSSRLLIKSDSYPKGVINTESLQNFTTNLFPGISHFAFNPPCDALSYNTLGEAYMWLNKTNDSLNLPEGSSSGNPLMIYKFTMSTRLIQSFEPIIKKLQALNEKNGPRVSSFIRKYRAILDTEKGFSIPK